MDAQAFPHKRVITLSSPQVTVLGVSYPGVRLLVCCALLPFTATWDRKGIKDARYDDTVARFGRNENRL